MCENLNELNALGRRGRFDSLTVLVCVIKFVYREIVAPRRKRRWYHIYHSMSEAR